VLSPALEVRTHKRAGSVVCAVVLCNRIGARWSHRSYTLVTRSRPRRQHDAASSRARRAHGRVPIAESLIARRHRAVNHFARVGPAASWSSHCWPGAIRKQGSCRRPAPNVAALARLFYCRCDSAPAARTRLGRSCKEARPCGRCLNCPAAGSRGFATIRLRLSAVAAWPLPDGGWQPDDVARPGSGTGSAPPFGAKALGRGPRQSGLVARGTWIGCFKSDDRQTWRSTDGVWQAQLERSRNSGHVSLAFYCPL
jgi:hypothetical protein